MLFLLLKSGTVVSLPNASNEIDVQVGALKTTININKLMKISNNNAKNKPNTLATNNRNIVINKSKNISPEINVIGLNVEEAKVIIDKYLDDANISKLETVRIVHGKGTGKLRSGIHSFLKTHPHVKSFRMGSFGEGEMGVTVVAIK